MMDLLNSQAQKEMQECAYNATKELFGQKIDVIFFDATTLYFESFEEDEFKQNGYSKDLKFSQPQVLISLMVTKKACQLAIKLFLDQLMKGTRLFLF
jgi:hypothetical protein